MTPEHTDMTGAARLREALENAEQTLRMIVDSFTSPAGDFIPDDLTRTEWRQMIAALDRVTDAREALAAVPQAPEPESKDSPSLSQSDELGA